MRPLHAILDAELHVVAQVVEAELVVGAVGDVGVVGVLALLVVEVVDDHADREAEELVEPAHPLRVAAGQVVVDGDDVNALAFEGVQVGRQGGDQRLAFTGLHFGDLALVQDHAADQLHVEMAHVEDAAAGFADHGEGFDQEVVERGALGDSFFEFNGFGGQVDIGECREARVPGRRLRPPWAACALISRSFLVPKTLARTASIMYRSRYGVESAKYYFTLYRETSAEEAS